MSNPETVLQMKGISKIFPGVKALDDVDFEVCKGEVHVLLGENGAGKSTLMRVLSGIIPKDGGEILLDGSPVEIRGISGAQALGISMIHQELNMLEDRSIAQNIFLGREPLKNRLGTVDAKKMLNDSKELLRRLEVDLDPQCMVRDLSVAQQQMVEVAKALSIKTKILIMDEPTSSLTTKEINRLFSIVHSLKRNGISIIYISHRMEEIFEIGDRVTVMRDGRYIGTVPVKETNMDDLITMMVGRKIDNLYGRTSHESGEEALRTEKLSGLRFRNVSISVRCGEIVGLGGLVGAGRTELAKAIFGYDRVDDGEIFLHGKKMRSRSPKGSVQRGLALLPEDRKNEGLVLEQPIKNNIIQASLYKLFRNYIVRRKVETETAETYRQELRIASPSVTVLVKSLSGGNQQKVVLGKWLCTGCDVLIFDEPTRGIDVGAKAEIYALMGGSLVFGFSSGFCSIATGSIGPVSNLLIISLLLFLILLFALKKTTYGRNVYAVGCNINATKLSGVNTDNVIFSVYIIDGLLAAVTGLLYIARLNAAECTIGSSFTMEMMAATLIGGTPFSGGKGGIERTLLGVLIMMFIENGMNLNGVSSQLQEAIFGVFILLSLIIDKIGSKYATNL